MNKNDKCDCHIIKELIINNKIPIDKLTKQELEALIDYEIEIISNSDIVVDNTFLNLCLEALRKYENYEDLIPLDEQRKIGKKVYEKLINSQKQKTTSKHTIIHKHFSVSKSIRVIVAATLLIIALSATIIACWNPLVHWFSSIRDIFDVKQGDVVSNEFGDLTADHNYLEFDTINELKTHINNDLILLDRFSEPIECIQLTTYGNKRCVSVYYKVTESEIKMQIYLENAPYKQSLLEQSNYERYIDPYTTWFIIPTESYQAICFYEKYVYVINAETYEELLNFLRGDSP